jgi:hypothetical protein
MWLWCFSLQVAGVFLSRASLNYSYVGVVCMRAWGFLIWESLWFVCIGFHPVFLKLTG